MSDPAMREAIGLQQAGRWQEAGDLYRRMLRANPRYFEALYSLGIVHLQLGELDMAQSLLGEALKLNPRFGEGWCARGIVLLQLRRREEAIACFDSALAILPNFVEALSSRATALLELNRFEEALAAFDRVLAVNPRHAISWNNRGNTFVAMGKHEEAVESFDKALALQPDLKIAQDNRALALLELKKVDRIPAHAVRTLFDDYASYYDDALLGSLKKRDHTNLRMLADRVLAPGTKGLRILDLGCGTGISGEAFKDLAEGGIMDGIDLSSLMLDGARTRGLYRNLIAGDFETVLASQTEHYDLIVAVDAFNYHGDLVPTLRGAARCLMHGGFCLFTVEQKPGQGWEHTPANRFRHSAAYLRETAVLSGLDFADLMQCELRNESEEPVAGFAVALKKRRGD